MSTVCDTRPALRCCCDQDADAVRQLQTMLNKEGGSSLAVDGVFGRNTEAALRKYQREHDLTASGVTTKETWQALCGAVPPPKPPSVCVARPRLECGSKDADSVREMQALLNKVGGYSIAVDGVFGPQTEATVKDFQAKKGIIVDGIVGNQTWGWLCGDTAPVPPPPKPTTVCETRPRLEKGSTDTESVRQMQQLLNQKGGYNITVDGIFGDQTYNTVRDYQTKNNLICDGIVGDQTWGSLCG